jgi:hypothetical protein
LEARLVKNETTVLRYVAIVSGKERDTLLLCINVAYVRKFQRKKRGREEKSDIKEKAE